MNVKSIDCQSPMFFIETICKTLKSSEDPFENKLRLVDKHSSQLSTLLNIEKTSSVIISLLFQYSYPQGEISMDEIGKFLEIDVFEIVRLQPFFTELLTKGFLTKKKTGFDREIKYYISTEFERSLIKDSTFVHSKKSNLTNEEFFRGIHRSIMKFHGNYEVSDLVNDLQQIIESNPSIPFSQYSLDNHLKLEEIFFLSVMLDGFFTHGTYLIELREFLNTFYPMEDLSETIDLSSLGNEIKNGSSILLKSKVIVPYRSEDFRRSYTYELSNEFIDRWFVDVPIYSNHTGNTTDLFQKLTPSEIKPQELFYNDENDNELNSFMDYLSNENLKLIMDRQKELGLPSNFVSLISGKSGLGKSEFVKQLGRLTNRDVFSVNLSQLKDCYFGESEKRMNKLFEIYGKYVEEVIKSGGDREGKRIPILLIDEIESILSSRKRIIQRSGTDNTIHTLINILLKRLDDFTGILIGTSNITTSIDPAFSRRFPFKFSIESPSPSVKGKIWKSNLSKFLGEEDCFRLGTMFDLSGGQIRNVTVKFYNHYILKNVIPEMSVIENWCYSEVKGFESSGAKTKIGFRSSVN